jgi:hypothetical protein
VYPYLLMVHGAWRWAVLGLGVAAVALALRGLLQKLPWEPRTALMTQLFGIAVDSQVLMGAALYLTLPSLTTVALKEVDASAGSDHFIGLDHAAVMIAALIVVHVGAVMVRRASSDAARHRRALLSYGLALLLILIGTPWWRPLLRL